MSAKKIPLLVVGAGAAGLVVSIGSAKAKREVLLIEKGNYGGDCTNFGCIPSKTLIAEAHRLHEARVLGAQFDQQAASQKALEKTREVVAHFRHHEDPPTLEGLGVKTCTGSARFKNPYTIEVQEVDGLLHEFEPNNIVLATGSAPAIPPIEGIESVPYLTNETLFQLTAVPKRLAILGGGAIGCEMAQAFSRLGSEVVLIEYFDHLFAREEPEVAQVMEPLLRQEGIEIRTGRAATKVSRNGKQIQITLHNEQERQTEEVLADALLVAVGRRPNLGSLNLEAADIDYSDRGIVVDKYGRCSKKHIWAIGDCSGGAMFTHQAEVEARAVLTSLLLPGPFKKQLPTQAVPRVTFTSPEVASIGLTEREAPGAKCYILPLQDVDRAQATHQTQGFIKVVTNKWSSKILGATVVAPCAGEILAQISLAMYAGVPMRKLAALTYAYPTYSRGVRKVADKWLSETVLPALRKWI